MERRLGYCGWVNDLYLIRGRKLQNDESSN